jgi:hypothetical protein
MKKFWTDAKILETLEKDRKLIPLAKRKPRGYSGYNTLAKLISEKNGFQHDNLKEVLDDLFTVMWEELLRGNRVYIPKIGSVYLSVVPPYKTNLQLKGMGNVLKPHIVAPRWDLKFHKNEEAMLFLKQREVSEEELDKIYEPTVSK